MTIKRKPLTCPVCGFRRLIDSSYATLTELRAEKDIEGLWIPDYFQKYPKCKNQIGIKKVS